MYKSGILTFIRMQNEFLNIEGMKLFVWSRDWFSERHWKIRFFFGVYLTCKLRNSLEMLGFSQRIVKFLMFKGCWCAQLSIYISYMSIAYISFCQNLWYYIMIYDIQNTSDNSKSKFRYLNIQKIGILKKINLNKIIDEKNEY